MDILVIHSLYIPYMHICFLDISMDILVMHSLYIPYMHMCFLDMFHVFSLVCFLIYSILFHMLQIFFPINNLFFLQAKPPV